MNQSTSFCSITIYIIILAISPIVRSQCANPSGPCDGFLLTCPPGFYCDGAAGECCEAATIYPSPQPVTGSPQSEMCPNSEGPCDGVMLLCPTQQCDVANGICCPSSSVSVAPMDCSDSEGPCDGVSILCPTQQCDVASGRCCPAESFVTGFTNSAFTAVSQSFTPTPSTCADMVNPITGYSDCPDFAFLCKTRVFEAFMAQQCPLTCGKCRPATVSASCTDRVGVNGVSDCPAIAFLCNNVAFYDVMTAQCAGTCGRCGAVTVTPRPCVDVVAPGAGFSSCRNRRHLCRHSAYRKLMRSQCPRTCGFCRS